MTGKTIKDILYENKHRLKPLSSDEITHSHYAPHEMFYFKNEDQELGPYYFQHMQEFMKSYPGFPYSTLIRSFDQTAWIPAYENDFFSRRKKTPEEMAEKNIFSVDEKTLFWYLDHGLKKGPINIHELQKRIVDKASLLTDEISLDQGRTWYRVFQLSSFDRRHRNQQNPHLPFIPQQGKFSSDQQLETLTAISGSPGQIKNDDIADLAVVGKLDARSIIDESQHHQEITSPFQVEANNSIFSFMPSLKWRLWGTIITSSVALIITFIYFFNDKNNAGFFAPDAQNSQDSQANLTDAQSDPDQQSKKAIRALSKRSPSPSSKTPVRNMRANRNNENLERSDARHRPDFNPLDSSDHASDENQDSFADQDSDSSDENAGEAAMTYQWDETPEFSENEEKSLENELKTINRNNKTEENYSEQENEENSSETSDDTSREIANENNSDVESQAFESEDSY
jgi:hypothetical protein